VEHARNIAGMRDADFEETAPASPVRIITRLAGSLAGLRQEVFAVPGSLAFKAYGKDRAVEQFACNYGLNEAYRNDIVRSGLAVAGEDRDGNARIVELSSHPFFTATLFLPQLSSKPGAPHPLIAAFLQAAAAFRRSRGRETWIAQGIRSGEK
jgi:CTP synthase (UTP-ammonia lyase)